MLAADFHTHSSFSEDSKAPMRDMCRAALEKGLTAICFTEHIDIGVYPAFFTIRDPEGYVRSVQAAREEFPELEIGLGVEVGAMPDSHAQEKELLDRLPLDYLLLSCHDAGGIDPYSLACYEGKSRAQVGLAYMESIYRGTLLYERFDGLAHIGYLYRYLARYGLYEPHERRYLADDAPDILDAILKRVIGAGAALELNMSEYAGGMTMPHPDILRRYVSLGGEAGIYGSDAHRPQDVGRHRREALEIMRSCGISYIASYRKRKQTLEKL